MADTDHASDAPHEGDYVHGSQDVSEQASTYSFFMTLAMWGSVMTGAIVLFLTIWFQPGGSFLGGAIAGLVVAVGGGVYLAQGGKKKH